MLFLRINSVNGLSGSEVSAETSVALEEERVTARRALDDLGQVEGSTFASLEFFSLFVAQKLWEKNIDDVT